MSTLRPIAAPVAHGEGDIERIRDRKGGTLDQEKARLRLAAKEFESLFMYQMLKSMRQTIGESSLAEGSPMSGSLGKDTFMDMFDIEMARDIATGGQGSISDILYASLEKTVLSEFHESPEEVEIKPLQDLSQVREPMQITRPELPVVTPGSRPVKITPADTGPKSISMTSRPADASPAAAPPAAPVERKGADRPNAVSRSQDPPAPVGRIVPRPVRAVAPPFTPETGDVGTDPILRKFGRFIDEAAERHQVDSALISAVIRTESAGNPNAVSPAGAKGLMQIMDTTAADLGVNDPFDAKENIMSGAKYLRQLLDRFGDEKLAVAAYNAGPGAVERHGGVPPFSETRAYVKKVLASLATYRTSNAGAAAKGGSDANR